MDETTRSVKLILELEQIFGHLQAAFYIFRQEPSLDDVWRMVGRRVMAVILGQFKLAGKMAIAVHRIVSRISAASRTRLGQTVVNTPFSHAACRFSFVSISQPSRSLHTIEPFRALN